MSKGTVYSRDFEDRSIADLLNEFQEDDVPVVDVYRFQDRSESAPRAPHVFISPLMYLTHPPISTWGKNVFPYTPSRLAPVRVSVARPSPTALELPIPHAHGLLL